MEHHFLEFNTLLQKKITLEKFKDYIDKNSQRFLNELFELIRIPSISALKENDSDTRLAAELIKKHLLNLGLNSLTFFLNISVYDCLYI